jgi:membrane protease subunit HflC
MNAKLVALAAGLLILLFALGSVFFTVREDQQAIVLQFGDPRRVIEDDAGLYAKLPIAQDVVYLDARNLEFDLDRPIEIIVANEERLQVDAFVRYIITDPLQYFQRFSQGSRDFRTMQRSFDNRLTNILGEAMREVLGSKRITQIIDTERVETMRTIQALVEAEARALGVEIVDVRIRQADLPDANALRVYERMISDYGQQAQRIRAEGDRRAQEIRAQADKEVVQILSEAEETAQKTRGQADGLRNAIFAEAYSRDPEFFAFYRSLNAYEEALQEGDTTMILSPDDEFFRYFQSGSGR